MTARPFFAAFEESVERFARSDAARRIITTLKTLFYYWVWSFPAWIVYGVVEEFVFNQRAAVVGAILFAILGPIYTIIVLISFVAAVTDGGFLQVDAGLALWRLSLVMPGLMICVFTVSSVWRSDARIKGWLSAALTAALCATIRAISGLATDGGYL